MIRVEPNRPALSYVLPNYTPHAYDCVDDDLALLRSLGFQIVTFVPTYYVRKCANRLQLDSSRTPAMSQQRRTFEKALKMGFVVRVTPHVDTRGQWRGRIALNPLADFECQDADYVSAILAPTLAAIDAALELIDSSGDDVCCAVLTLGSELERSMALFPECWMGVLQRMIALRSECAHGDRIDFCHNLNWDHPLRLRASEARDRYLKKLDRVSISFYPPVPYAIRRHEKHDDFVTRLAAERAQAYLAHTFWLRKLNRRIDLGEIGLGSANLGAPNEYHPRAFEGKRAVKLRREYWTAVLRFLAGAGLEPGMAPSPLHATIWSAGVYNILGTSGCLEERDDEIASIIQQYNEGHWPESDFL